MESFWYLMFVPDAKDGNILNIRVDSGEGEGKDVCAVVSVQKPGGPVWDDEARIRYSRYLIL